VGVVVRGPKIGKSMFELMDIEGDPKEDVIAGSFEEVIKDNSADIAIICTDSFVKESFDKIKYCIERKINVISTAEEMSYPKAQESKLSEELDNIARENDVTILGTGINPGLIMDLLVIALTGASINVENIEVERINNLSPFGPAVMAGQGVGI